MLTILSVPKAFRGHIATIQRNAITSWTRLRPPPEIILFGDEEGTAAITSELGLRHAPALAVNENGAPLLDDLLRRGQQLASNHLLCYVNADIILIREWMGALEKVSRRMDKFLVVANRINVDVREPIAFGAEWDNSQKAQLLARGEVGPHTAVDVFAFPKGTYPQVPPFAIGRLWFDQWFIKAARLNGVPVVDVSRMAPVLHQNHDYNHVSGGTDWVWRGKEAARNLQFYGEAPHTFTLLDATHELTLHRGFEPVFFRKQRFAAKQLLWEIFVRRTFPLRKRLGLCRDTVCGAFAGKHECGG